MAPVALSNTRARGQPACPISSRMRWAMITASRSLRSSSAVSASESLAAIEKSLRLGEAKAINALFYVADAEEVRRLFPLPVLRERVRERVHFFSAEKCTLSPALSLSTGRGSKALAADQRQDGILH